MSARLEISNVLALRIVGSRKMVEDLARDSESVHPIDAYGRQLHFFHG